MKSCIVCFNKVCTCSPRTENVETLKKDKKKKEAQEAFKKDCKKRKKEVDLNDLGEALTLEIPNFLM